jgi:hypothetical protein
MKTRITENSIEAFLQSDKKTGCKRIYEALKLRGSSTYTELVFYTGLKLPTVTGRLNDLRYKFKLIVADGSKNDKTLYRLRKDGEPADELPMSWEQKYNELLAKYNEMLAKYIELKEL